MTTFVLFAILIVQIITIILVCMKNGEDFSKEDREVKAATDRVKSTTDAVNVAQNNLPLQS